MKYLFHSFMLLPALLIADTTITCTPQNLRGVPGQPLQVEITIETDRVAPIQLRIPHSPSLFLRTVEKIPIQRTKQGRYVQKRIIIWQGLEAASLTLTNLVVSFQSLENVDATSSSRFQGLEKKVAGIGIIIDEVNPAEPPPKKEAEEEE